MNAIAKVEHGMSFDQMKERASLLRKSGFLPVALNTDEKVLTVMLTGQELGLGFMESLRSINVVQGKPCMSAQLLLGLCHKTKEVEQAFFEKQSAQECVFVLQRKGSPPYKSVWNMDHARAMGLDARDNWKKQPQQMLEWRAISKAARIVFPDAICGLYTPEELSEGVDVLENPDTGEVKVVEIQAPTKDIAKETAAAVAAEALPPTEGAAGLDNPLEVDRLGQHYPLPPYNGYFPDRCIMEIYGVTTPAGKPKGKPFLEMLAKSSKDDKERAIVTRFLEAMEKEK